MADYLIFEGIALGDAPAVERAADGLPAAWRLLRTGENLLTKDGKPYRLTLSGETVAGMAAFARDKGAKIPVDSRHALFLAAEKHGVDESEVRKLLPHGTAALGFAGLEARDDGLWAVDVEWLPLAAELVRDGMFRYFSPVIRGLNPGGIPRVSSIALDNVPALNHLDVIAAGDQVEQPKEAVMPESLTNALRQLLGDDALALGDAQQTEAVAAKVLALAAELPTLREKAQRADTLALEAENTQRNAVIDRGLASGVFNNAQRPTLEKLPLSDVEDLEKAGKPGSAVPTQPLPKPEEEKDKEEELSDDERKMARALNLSESDFKAARKAAKQQQEGC